MRNLKRITPWFYTMAIISIWHIWRGALGDAIIFGLPAVLLLLDSLDYRPIRLVKRSYVRPELVIVFALLVWSTLSFSPRYNIVVSFVFIVLMILSFMSIWSLDLGRRPKMTTQYRRATAVWILLIVLLCIVEFGAYATATLNGGDDFNYPTITVLLDPVLNFVPQRMVLVALWVALGMKFNRWQVRR